MIFQRKTLLKLSWVTFLFISAHLCVGQTRILKLQFHLEGKPIQKILSGTIGIDKFKTNPKGYKELVIEDNQVDIPISLDKYQNHEILYPSSLVIPIDESYVVPIYVGVKGKTKNDYNILLKKIDQKITNLRGQDLDINELKNELALLFQQQNSAIDGKILNGIQQQVQVLEEIRMSNQKKRELLDLEKNRTVKEGKMKTLNAIGSTFDHYLSRLKDLRDAFKFRGDQAFDDDEIVSYLQKRIDNYSLAYEQLDELRKTIMNDITQYWEDQMLTFEWRTLLNETLERTHKQTVLKRNEIIIEDINKYNKGGRKQRKGKKAVIKNEIKSFVSELSHQIEFLEKEKERLYQKLMDN